MLKQMILATLLITSISASSAEDDKTERQKLDEYEECIKRQPKCKHDGESLSELPEKERKEEFVCRARRMLECSKPEPENE